MDSINIDYLKTGFAIMIGIVLLYVLILEPIFKKGNNENRTVNFRERKPLIELEESFDEDAFSEEELAGKDDLAKRIEDVKKNPQVSTEVIKNWLKK